MALMTELGPEGQASIYVQEAQRMGSAALDEVGALPGVDQLRCGLLRVLHELLEPDEMDAAVHAAEHALQTYPGMTQADDPMLGLVRHPAWVGLAQLEIAERKGDLQEADWDRAVFLASTGFQHLGRTGRGEVLWAMAEHADGVGWTARATQVLRQAIVAPFEDESLRGEVRLLLGLRLAEDGDVEAQQVLTSVAEAPGPTQRRVHARWVLSALVRESDPHAAMAQLSEALVLVESDEDASEDILTTLKQALAALGAPTVGTA
jgi:hypothetical protein